MRRFSSYVVRRGDSLWKISSMAYGSGARWPEIQAANALVLKRGTTIYRGQKLQIPNEGVYRNFAPQGVPGVPSPHVPQAGSHPQESSAKLASGVSAGSHPISPLHAASGEGPFEPAKPILFPAFKFPIEGMKMEADTPNAHYEAKFTGELTMQQEGVITGGVTFSKEGVEVEYKKTCSSTFNEMFTKAVPKFDGKKVTMELGIGGSAKLNGQVLYTTETTLVPPMTTKFSMKSREIKGTYKGFEFAGTMGFEVSITPKKNGQDPEAIPQESVNWVKVGAVALIATAAVIVIADIVKDIGTLGVGAAESPLSFAAAAALFGRGMAAFQ